MGTMNLEELDNFIGNVNSIADAVSSVRDNITKRRDSFLNNERQTRSGLIDPILKILGWDVSQVDLVGSEYRTKSSGTADYALIDGGAPLALIEAKRLGSKFDVDISEQLANYTGNEPTVQFAVFTNGDHWRMRQTGKSGTVFDIKLSYQDPLKSALELIHLSRDVLIGDGTEKPAIESDQLGAQIQRGDAATDQTTVPIQTQISNRDADLSADSKGSGQQRSAPTGWVMLGDVQFQTGDPRPRGLILPGATDPVAIKTYKDLWVSIVEWLAEITSRSEWNRYFFDQFASVHPPDPRKQPGPRRLSNQLWLATNFSTKDNGKNIRNALSHFHVSPNEFLVTFEDYGSSSTSVIDRSMTAKPTHSAPRPPRLERSEGWHSLGNHKAWSATHRKPKAVQIGGESHEVSEWADFTQFIGNWLVSTSRIAHDDCPVSVTRSKNRCLVNIRPEHPDGKPFIAHSMRQLSGGLWIETNHGAEQHVDYAGRLVEKFGIDPNQVFVLLD